MSLPSLGPALPIPNGAEPIEHITENNSPFPVDLGAYQRAIIAQLQADQGRLVECERECLRLREAIISGRGKLDLLAELAQQKI
jgi:hypothetical protein